MGVFKNDHATPTSTCHIYIHAHTYPYVVFREIAHRLGVQMHSDWFSVNLHTNTPDVGICMWVWHLHGCWTWLFLNTPHPHLVLILFTSSSLHFKTCLFVYFLMAFGHFKLINLNSVHAATSINTLISKSAQFCVFDISLQVHSLQNQRGKPESGSYHMSSSRVKVCSMRAAPFSAFHTWPS